MPAALFLCERSGQSAAPWAAAGYDCWCVDVQHAIRKDRIEGRVRYVWGDVRSWCPPSGIRFDFVAAFPPCTDVTISGSQDWIKKGHYLLTDALELFAACQMAASYAGAPYMIENPVGALSKHMREPDYRFDPCDYAGYADEPWLEAYTKRTCLWTGGGFVMPPPKRVEPFLGSKMHLMGPSKNRANDRAETPTGFARAVQLVNSL